MQVKLMEKKINYIVQGEGSPILFVHGWGGNISSLKGLYEGLCEKYTCYVLDLPGFGESENPEDSWGVEEYGEILKEFVEKVIGQTTIYCGHSFGGSLGIYLASKTNLLEKMIVIAPSYKRDSEKKVSLSNSKIYSKLKKPLYPLRRIFYKIMYPHSQALSYPHLEENFRKIVTQDLTHLLEEIEISVLILWGTNDSFVNVNDGYFLKKMLKKSELKVYNGEEHNLPMVRADEVVSDIICFLNKS